MTMSAEGAILYVPHFESFAIFIFLMPKAAAFPYPFILSAAAQAGERKEISNGINL
ncbi:MAG TPA: hypothetical protein VMG30_16030 [Acidobacteriota bacterium]|nr:hypothetical protein [Acidobacteriota bacterium]